MNILTGAKNLLEFINNNWTLILVICGLGVSVFKKAKDYISKTDEEKIEIAKVQIKEKMLKMITDAEIDFENWNKAGSIKRSKVIGDIFAQYPILSKVTSQEEVIEWIDTEINNSLVTLREIIEKNKETTE